MRLRPEQFDARRENRITGAYEIKAPNTFRRRQKGPSCAQCGRETEYLFAGGVKTEVRGGIGQRVRTIYRDALVCQRCRPASNLERQEILEAGRYKGQTLELRNESR